MGSSELIDCCNQFADVLGVTRDSLYIDTDAYGTSVLLVIPYKGYEIVMAVTACTKSSALTIHTYKTKHALSTRSLGELSKCVRDPLYMNSRCGTASLKCVQSYTLEVCHDEIMEAMADNLIYLL